MTFGYPNIYQFILFREALSIYYKGLMNDTRNLSQIYFARNNQLGGRT